MCCSPYLGLKTDQNNHSSDFYSVQIMLLEFSICVPHQVQKSVSTLEHHMFRMYENQRAVIEAKLQELFAILDRVAVSETELDNFKQSLNRLYEEMQNLE